ncbi:2-polyprenyl-3-methyl-5-hydroxy-6-metoxy-1,4-benzoquinol methylase [Methanolinea mesophila]|uniref:class I SAM-dependent methyltransferase n=1 Tax=Methanolinea mesophila TaxID=547055 RepID=UPI001AEB574A|nr:class I SAM-dependent methyltransferase [Methanolinea mesophila]MBP1928314.1 2-polyprenyl-3-methyl-5-hydroxy-6-metoxy-1,4-benzoquinol methylase [Methanolinea mesophila]
MAHDEDQLLHDETSGKYFKRSTGWITRIFIRNVVRELEELNPDTVLDVGCGTGYVTDIIGGALNVSVIGCDLERERLLIAKTRFNQQVIMADITRLPFRDGSFDAIVAMEILEHLQHPDAALTEMKRVARKNIVITVPNDPYFMLANMMRGKNVKNFGNPPDHILHFNKSSFARYLSGSFRNVAVRTNAWLWLLATMYLH